MGPPPALASAVALRATVDKCPGRPRRATYSFAPHRSRRRPQCLGRSQRLLDGRAVRVASLARRRIPGERHRKPADQPFAAPIELGLAAELALDARDHAARAETTRDRLLHRRAAMLFPEELQRVRLRFPS